MTAEPSLKSYYSRKTSRVSKKTFGLSLSAVWSTLRTSLLASERRIELSIPIVKTISESIVPVTPITSLVLLG